MESLSLVVGWTATVVGATLGLPQLFHILKTKSVAGMSLLAWQNMLVVGLIWFAHGFSIGQAPQIVTTGIGTLVTLPILVLMVRHLERRLLPVLLPCLLASAALIAVDRIFGSTVFGIVAIVPAVLANAGQSVELVRAVSLHGVSLAYTIAAVVNQVLWFVWALLIGDPGSAISAGSGLAIIGFNLVWLILRRAGLRAFFPHGTDIEEPAVIDVAGMPVRAD